MTEETTPTSPSVMNRINKRVLRVLTFPQKTTEVKKFIEPGDEAGKSVAVNEDPFIELVGAGQIIEPPFDMLSLSIMPEHNSEMTGVLEVMETNIEGFGHHLESRVDLNAKDITPELYDAVQRERVHLENFFNYISLRDSFTMLRKKTRRDLEATGNAYWEVVRSMNGNIQGFTHLPSYQMRMTPVEIEAFDVDWPILELQIDGSVQVRFVRTWERFRRFVQSRSTPLYGSFGRVASSAYRMRWFKEFGDPRIYDNDNGDLVPDEEVANWKASGQPMPVDKRANEVLHFKIYSSRSPYGIPRYIGNMLSIVGDRASEEINFTTLKNNNIPSMAVIVSGNAQLTAGSIDRIEKFVESNIQGSANYSRMLILEAESQYESDDQSGTTKIEIKPLVDSQHKDALFVNYRKGNRESIRRVWRIPPIFVGMSEDYTRATADSSRVLGDEQIFAPERQEFDSLINRRIFPVMGIIYHKFKSNSPNTTDNAELVQILSGSEKTGGMTPRIARAVLEDILGKQLPPFPEGFDPDVPFSLTMADAVKNLADPTQPGQQVTALKTLEVLGFKNSDEAPAGLEALNLLDIEMIRSLVKIRDRFDRMFREKEKAQQARDNE